MGRLLGPPADPVSIPPSNRATQTTLPPSHPARFLTRHKIPDFQHLLLPREQSVDDEEFPGKRRSPGDSLHTTDQSRFRHRSSEFQRNFRSAQFRPPPPKKVVDCFSLPELCPG